MPRKRSRITAIRSRNIEDERSITSSRSLKFKICLIGDGAVGKTALRKRFMGEGFRSSYMFTVGADFAVKQIEIKDADNGDPITITFQIWDLAGQPQFKEVRKSFYNGAKGALVVFDMTNPESWKNVPHWIQELWSNNGSGRIPFILVGNKLDLKHTVKSYISPKTVNEWKERFEKQYETSVMYIQTSAKTGENVEEAFHALGTQIRDSIIKRSTSTI